MSYRLGRDTAVAVIGAGSMGAGLAQLAAQSGHSVLLFDAKAGAAGEAVKRIAADLKGAAQRGRITAQECEGTLGKIHVAEAVESLEGCGLAIEAIVEKLDVKRSVFQQLEAVLGTEAVLATNTSSISITAIAQGLRRPQRLIGWHFFNPATRMKLVEVIPGVETDPALVSAMHVLSREWGKVSVDAPNAPGFIVNRVARPYYAEALRLLAEQAAAPSTIDKLLREAGGFAMGPFELMDLIGVDVNLSVTESVFQATGHDDRYTPHLIQQELVRSGRFGRKSGRGFYSYKEGASDVATVEAVAPAAACKELRVSYTAGLLEPLVQRLARSGVAVTRDYCLSDQTMAVDETVIAVTDGRTAAQYAEIRQAGPVVLLDLARDYATTTMIGASANVRGEAHLPEVAAVLQSAGIELIALADVAGLVVMRLVCCLANEGADVVTWSGAKPADIDTAMRLGTNYPIGPLAWAEQIGVSRVVNVLSNLHAHYGVARYRRAPSLSRAHFERGSFHG